MSKRLHKLFSGFVTLTTILWSVGFGTLALPSVASAATLSAGDLIKASGPAVYYYAADQKRYVFPNEKTYWSWYQDFSSVNTITDGELAAIMIGGNVTIRPGTKLVKITTDPKTYAVTKGGVLHWVESEAVATALYGANWAQRVVDVPDGFFVNYTVGSSIPTAVHPDGTLISYTGSTDKFVVSNGKKRKISSDAWTANGWNATNVIQTTVVYPAGSDVTARESAYADTIVAVAAPGPGPGPVSTGTLSVALATDTPAGVTVPKNAASVMLAKFTFTASAGDVVITGLRFHRVGIGSTTDFSNVYLYDGNGTRLTSGRTVNSTTNLVEFNSLNVTIKQGTPMSFVLQGDFSGPSSTGGQHGFELQDPAAVVISGSGTVGGSFPVRGNVFTVGTASAARVDVQVGTQPTNPNVGQSDVEISNFKLVANTNDVEIRRMTLLQAGSITNTDLSALTLYQGATPVATAAALMNDKIVLNFNPPFLLTNGTTKTFSLKAKVAGRSGRTIRTYVEYTTDVYAIDKVYNSGANVCIASSGTCTTGSFDGTGTTNYVEVTTQGGQLTVAFNGPATQNIAKGSQDVMLYKFALTSSDSDLEIKNIPFFIAGTTATSLVKGNGVVATASDGTEYFRDIKIKNLDTGATVMGPTSLPSTLADASNTSGKITLSDAFTLKMGTTLNLVITSDLANAEDSTDAGQGNGFIGKSYQVRLDNNSSAIFGSTDVRIVNTGEYLATSKIVPNSPITGNAMTVKNSSLDISLAGSPSSNTYVKKQTNVPALGLVLTSGAQSDILVTSIKLTGSGKTVAGGAYTAANLTNVVTSCALYDGNSQVGLAQAPDTTLGTMNITNMNLKLPKGSSKTLTVNCTADSVVNSTSTGDSFAIGIATASTDVTAQDQDSNSVTATLSSGVTGNAGLTGQAVIQTIASAGTLTIATDNLRQATILVMGGDVWQNLAQFKGTAQYEDMTIDRINVTSTGDASNFTSVAIAKDGAVKGWDVLPSGSLRNKDVDLSANPITIPKGGSATFQIWGKLANAQSSSSVSGATTGVARSGNTVALGIGANLSSGEWNSNYNDKFNIRATGAASGDRVYATSSNMNGGTTGNTFVLRRTKPTVVRQALSSTTLVSGQDSDLYKFQVSADNAGSVSLKKFILTFSKSTSSGSSLSLSNFRLRRGATDVAQADIRIVNDNERDLYAGTWNTASTTGSVIVSFTNEDTIAGSGNVYTLHATVGGTIVSGDSISLSFYRTGGSTVVTGYLTGQSVTSSGGVVGPNIDTSVSAINTAGAVGTFLWSDQSEVPHNSSVGTSSGSRDWTDDVYVEDLTSSQSLSR